MQKPDKIDCSKLLGFATVSEEISGKLDLRDATISDKLGAKVGFEPNEPPVELVAAKQG